MGYDVSYLPVDVTFFHETLFPIVRGELEPDAVFAGAARIAKNRLIAGAYGLAVASVAHDASDSVPEPDPEPPGPVARLLGKLRRSGWAEAEMRAYRDAREYAVRELVGAFDSDLHTCGRPFFIVTDVAEEISTLIDDYVAADALGATTLAREMVKRLNPALLEGVKASHVRSKTFQQHLEENLCRLPDEADVEEDAVSGIRLFREAWQALGTGRTVRDERGQRYDPDRLFATDFALAMVQFASLYRPGWLERGLVWPTLLFARAGLNTDQFFEPAEVLFAPMLEQVPQIRTKLLPTITENYTLGGYVPADRVPHLLRYATANLKRLKDVYEPESPLDDVPGYLAKLLEALRDASTRGIAFLEASEVL